MDYQAGGLHPKEWPPMALPCNTHDKSSASREGSRRWSVVLSLSSSWRGRRRQGLVHLTTGDIKWAFDLAAGGRRSARQEWVRFHPGDRDQSRSARAVVEAATRPRRLDHSDPARGNPADANLIAALSPTKRKGGDARTSAASRSMRRRAASRSSRLRARPKAAARSMRRCS